MNPYSLIPTAPPAPSRPLPHVSPPDIVYQGVVYDGYPVDKEDDGSDLSQIEAVFTVSPPAPRDQFEDAASKFQSLIEDDPDNEATLDASGSGDIRGWTSEFCACNLTDCCVSLEAAKDKVTALAERFRAHMVAAGISCGPVVVTIT